MNNASKSLSQPCEDNQYCQILVPVTINNAHIFSWYALYTLIRQTDHDLANTADIRMHRNEVQLKCDSTKNTKVKAQVQYLGAVTKHFQLLPRQ